MIVILSKCKTVISQQYLNFINGSDKPIEKNTAKHITTKEELQAKVDNRKFIDHGTNEIIYNNSKIIFFEYNEILYLKAKDVCDLLGYINYSDAINTHIDKEDIFLFNEVGNRKSQIPIPHDNTSEYINELPLKTNKDIEDIKKLN
jgi:hypothetical protein